MGDKKTTRNPLIIPNVRPEPADRPRCPACKSSNFGGRRVSGTIFFTCYGCNNHWEGGLPQEPEDPRRPSLPPVPGTVDYYHNQRTGETEELREPISTVPDFRRGVPVPPDEGW